jgi:hypothetical protein
MRENGKKIRADVKRIFRYWQMPTPMLDPMSTFSGSFALAN